MTLLTASAAERSEAVKALGRGIGFDDVGIAAPGPHPEMDLFAEWLEKGYHGQMQYMHRHRRRRREPQRVLPGLKAVIMAALDYNTDHTLSVDAGADPERGWISRYAWGDDYHTVMEPMLQGWCEELSARAPGHRFVHYVDHGPVLEKVYARYAGLGWMGKHTNIIHPQRGSWFFLAAILTDLELAADSAVVDHCGSCTACLDACPTQAFVAPYVLDASRCISYLTIELDGDIPASLQDAVGGNVYGCDICQDVCPWNRKPAPDGHPAFQPRDGLVAPRLDALAALDDDMFAETFADSPIARRGRAGLQHAVGVARGDRS